MKHYKYRDIRKRTTSEIRRTDVNKRSRTKLTMDINLFEDNDADTRQIQRLGHYDRALIMLWLENMSYDESAKTCAR